ncbi:WXG100-like domain-containing protein [Actinoallomurus soli]|uniref:WXG100-like domain-containing protein n=1 Tax=Actinoallomurus soli TaxID=2952535 RepID=UPI002093FE1D|nr:hypothetical protein [Actinoallomurus soli]MCO5968779.1 hypothetical protein [Actinoallomurus soli]
MTAGYTATPHTWIASGRGVGAAADSLAQAVDVLCGALGALGDCWGDDDIGRDFFNGDDKTAGFRASRDALLVELADMVNLLRATGGTLILAGHRYRLAEEAATLGSELPEGADEGAIAAKRPYRLPPVAGGLVESDPPPHGREHILRILQTLVAGCQWPDGNVISLAAMRDALYEAARSVEAVADEVGGHARNVSANNGGQAAEKFASFAAALQGDGERGGLLWLAAACKRLGDAVDFLIRQKKAARVQFDRSLEFLAATWAIAGAISWLTDGASIGTATAITEAQGSLLAAFLRTVAKLVLQGMWYAGGLDLIGQKARIDEGVQDGFHTGEFLKALGEGGTAAGVMGLAGTAVAARSNELTRAMADLMSAAGVKGAASRILFAGTTGTMGNVVAQFAFENGHVDLAQAAGFGFGMAGIGAAGDAGRHFADRFSSPGHPAGAPGDFGPGDSGAGPQGPTIPDSREHHAFYKNGIGCEVVARDGVPVSGTTGDGGGPTGHPGGAGATQAGSGPSYDGGGAYSGGQTVGADRTGGGTSHGGGPSYDGDPSYGDGSAHDGGTSYGDGRTRGEVVVRDAGTVAPAGATGHVDLAGMGGREAGAGLPARVTEPGLPAPVTGGGHPVEPIVPSAPAPGAGPVLFVTPGNGGVGTGEVPGPAGEIARLPAGPSAPAPVVPPGPSAPVPVVPPGPSATSPVLPPSPSAPAPVLSPGPSATSSSPAPGPSATAPVPRPGTDDTSAGEAPRGPAVAPPTGTTTKALTEPAERTAAEARPAVEPGTEGGGGRPIPPSGASRGAPAGPSSGSDRRGVSRIQRLLNFSPEEAHQPAPETPPDRTEHPDETGVPANRQDPAGDPAAAPAATPEPPAPPTETGGDGPAVEPRPEIRPPRYTDYGALGDATAVQGVSLPADPREVARRWAQTLPDYLPPRVRADIETRVRDHLSDPDVDRWTDLLQNGIAFESRGHVVWLKPKLDTFTHVETPAGARQYAVSFGGTGAGSRETVRGQRGNSGGVVEFLDNSDGLERVSLPGPGVSKVSGRSHTSTAEVMAGHKAVAFKHDFFTSTVNYEVHVNGSEAGIGAVVDGLSLTVPFPEQFHREGATGAGGDRPPTPRHLVTSDRAPGVRKHEVRVNAVQPDRLVTEFQRRALQAGMSPKQVAEVVNRNLTGHIGQQILLNRSRDLLNGELVTPDATITSRVLRLEHLPDSDTPIREAVLRDDQGLLTTTNDSRQFGHKWNVMFGMKLGVDNPAAKFFARIGGNYQGGKNHVLSYSHTTLPKITLVRKAEIARYHAIVRLEVQTRFGDFPVDIPMELAVRASEAPQFERDLLGDVRTEGLARPASAAPAGEPGPGGHTPDPNPAVHSPDPDSGGRAPEQGSAAPVPEPALAEHNADSGPAGHHPEPGSSPVVPVGPEHSPPVAPHEPHPAEPVHLAAGRGAGLGKLTGLPGSERVVTELREAIDTALPSLSEPVRRQLARDLEARFGRSAMEGVSLADLLHGQSHDITIGRHRIEISHRAELGGRRSVEEFDMTVNDRKVAGSGTSAGQNRSSGGGVEVAGNVRFQVGRFGVDAPKVSLHGGRSRSKTVSFMGGTTEYRRTETDGPVTQITKELRHEVGLRVYDGGKRLADRSWTIHGDDVSAQAVVPREHAPAARATPQEIAKAGRVHRVDALPEDRIDFAGQTTGVFPGFAAAHDLPFEVARIEAEANGRPAPTDLLGIPTEILDATRPSSLEAHLAELTSRDGWRVHLTQPDGTTRAVTLRASFGRPEHAVARTGIEIEHYRAANTRMRAGTSTDIRAEGELKAGFRSKIKTAGTEYKGVGEAGGMAEVDRRTGASEYTGASDVIRGTYSSAGLTHSFGGSDLYLSVTPDAPAGRPAPTTHLRVHGGADFMMPDRIARDHHLAAPPDVHVHETEGEPATGTPQPETPQPETPQPETPQPETPQLETPQLETPQPVTPQPVSEPRTYRPDLAITSAHVERFDGRDVLPTVEDVLETRGLLPEGDDVARELLRTAFGEQALAANMPSLRRGVVQWYPVESAYGFTRHVGVRVRAVLEGGTHTAERPDVSHMARNQGLSGSEAGRERGFGRGWKGLVRGVAEGIGGGHGHGKGGTGGGQFGGGRIHRSETGHSDGVGRKDIDRRQTREGSQEFTHGLRFEIEVVESKEPPYGLEQGISAIRRGADALARLTGNEAAARYFDRHLSAETETATARGSVRLVVPHHLTTVAGEGAHAPGWEPVAGRFARWADHTPPTAANRALGDMVGRISFPGAEVVHHYAPIAALPPERRGPIPAQTERPTGFELSRPQGMTLWRQTDPATLMSKITSLLDHTYEVAGLRPGEHVTVGMNVVALKEDAQALLKRREYTQTATNQRDGASTATDSSLRGAGSAGSPGGHGVMVSHGRGTGSGVAREADGSHIRERNIEVTDQNVMYSADVVLVFHRDGAPDLLVDVSDALHIRLTEDDAAELGRRHPGLIRRPAGIENPPAPGTGDPLASPGNQEPEPVNRPDAG